MCLFNTHPLRIANSHHFELANRVRSSKVILPSSSALLLNNQLFMTDLSSDTVNCAMHLFIFVRDLYLYATVLNVVVFKIYWVYTSE